MSVPVELRELDRWVVWRWEPDPKNPRKPKKPPYCPANLSRHASSTKPETWATFEQAVAVVDAGRADGIGFALEPPWVLVDLDEELPENDRGVIMFALDSYSERSPSGAGYHVIVRANLNGHGRHPEGIGVFQTERFAYFTGEHVFGTPETIEDRQEQLEQVLAYFLPEPERKQEPRPSQPVDLDDRELLERMFAASNGSDIRRLWDGDTSAHDNNHSRADAALLSHLAYYTAREPARMERMFSASALGQRDKWTERDDYRTRSIEFAISGCSEVYERPSSELTRRQKSVESVGDSGEGKDATDSLTQPYRVSVSELVPSRGFGTDSEPGSVSDSGRPFALSLDEFVKRPRERRKPLLADADGRASVGALSLVLLGALGGQGKTTFVIDLLLHLAAGVDYPPWTVPQPVSILVIENEGPEELFADKLEARRSHFPHKLKAALDIHVLDWGSFNLADAELRERLTREAAKYDLIFGDPLDSLGIEGVGSPADTRAFLALMKETGLNKSVAWWLNTHPRKEETKEALNEIAGAWGGKPDSVFLLRMLDDDRTFLRQPKLRWAKRGRGPSLLFGFDVETEAFTFLGEQSEEERDYKAEIVALLADGEWRTPKEIAVKKDAGGIGANVDTVKKILGEHPDVFESRTKDAAKAVGRSPQATVWQLLDDEGEGEDEITFADLQQTILDTQRRTGKYGHPLSDMTAEAQRRKSEGQS